MKCVVKKPSRALTALRRRTASSSTAATAWRASLRDWGSAGTAATSVPSSGRWTVTSSAPRAEVMRSVRLPVRVAASVCSDAAGGRAHAAAAYRGGVLSGQGPRQRLAGGGLDRDRAGHRGGREAGVGESEAQRVQMAHEPGVDDGDPLGRRYGGEECLGVTGVGGDPHVEAEGPQIALERRSGTG